MTLEKKYLLGFDVGTYESKGVICDYSGKILASTAAKHVLKNPKPGFAEHDPVGDWWNDFKTVVKELLDTTGVKAEEIGCIGISAICTAIVPCDDDFNPLRPAILYAIDSRSVPQCEELNTKLPADVVKKFGGPFTVEHFGPKILWIKENEPEIFAKTKKITFDAGWLVGKLTGNNVVDKYSVGGCLPMINLEDISWNKEMVEMICSMDVLPEIKQSTYDIAGQVTEKAAIETGLFAGTPVICGTTDAGAEAVSVGVINPGDVMLMYGSTAFWVGVCSKEEEEKLGAIHYPYTIDNRGCYAGGMATTGSLTRWLLDKTARELVADEANGGPSAYGTLFKEAEDIPVGSDGLICLPYFMGERKPIEDPNAKGVYFGLNLMHGRGHLVHAAFEGIAYGVRQNIEHIRNQGFEVKELTAVGGGTKSPLWLQIVSDVCNIRQVVPEVIVGASYGDALMAGLAIGAIESPEKIKELVKVKYVVEPDPVKHEQYSKYYEIFKKLYENNKDLMHQL